MARAKGPRFEDVEGVEDREFAIISSRSAHGRSTVTISCPFCSASVVAYTWSLAGGGKRCGCGALFGSTGVARHWGVDRG